MKRLSGGKVLSSVFIFLLAISVIVPVFWMLSASFMHITEVFEVPMRWFPRKILFESYERLFTRQPFALFYLNSAIVSVVQTGCNVFFSLLTGLAVSNKYR